MSEQDKAELEAKAEKLIAAMPPLVQKHRYYLHSFLFAEQSKIVSDELCTLARNLAHEYTRNYCGLLDKNMLFQFTQLAIHFIRSSFPEEEQDEQINRYRTILAEQIPEAERCSQLMEDYRVKGELEEKLLVDLGILRMVFVEGRVGLVNFFLTDLYEIFKNGPTDKDNKMSHQEREVKLMPFLYEQFDKFQAQVVQKLQDMKPKMRNCFVVEQIALTICIILMGACVNAEERAEMIQELEKVLMISIQINFNSFIKRH